MKKSFGNINDKKKMIKFLKTKLSTPKYHIVIVDDDSLVLKLSIERIKRSFTGIKVSTFNCPQKALKYSNVQKMKGEKVDLFLIDWMMPIITGDMLSILVKELFTESYVFLYTLSTDIIREHLGSYKIDLLFDKTQDIHEFVEMIDIFKQLYHKKINIEDVETRYRKVYNFHNKNKV